MLMLIAFFCVHRPDILIIMTNITSTILEILTLNYTAEWPVESPVDNGSENDTLSFIITPWALSSKHHKHHVHPESVSPVTLSTEWSRLARLIFLTIMSVIGSVGNIFMISSVMIEDHLKKAGENISVSSLHLEQLIFLLLRHRQIYHQNRISLGVANKFSFTTE